MACGFCGSRLISKGERGLECCGCGRPLLLSRVESRPPLSLRQRLLALVVCIGALPLVGAIAASKSRPWAAALYGLGIRHVGTVNAKTLAQHLPSVAALAAAPSDRLASIEGIGPEIAQAVSQWFANPANQTLIERLQQAGLTLASTEPTATAADQPLAGKTFVLTGTLPHLTRPQATAKIEAAGGKVVSSVSQVTDYLVAGDKAGSKLTKAEKLGIPILDETALLNLISTIDDG